jgi:hypothetical protein
VTSRTGSRHPTSGDYAPPSATGPRPKLDAPGRNA